METQKLQAYMAHAGIASRRASEKLIAEGKVRVNGEVAHIGQRITPGKDTVTVSGKGIHESEQLRYFLIYKPIGYVSTVSDDLNRKTVVGLIPQIKERLYPVGRLDQDSEGLMLLTNDGNLAHAITHPSHKIPKTYRVTVTGRPTYKALNLMREGVKLKEGFTRPDKFEKVEEAEDSTTFEMTIHQGYNRQVRRMFDRIGYSVIRLQRIKLGELSVELLDGKPYRELSPTEVATSTNKV